MLHARFFQVEIRRTALPGTLPDAFSPAGNSKHACMLFFLTYLLFERGGWSFTDEGTGRLFSVSRDAWAGDHLRLAETTLYTQPIPRCHVVVWAAG